MKLNFQKIAIAAAIAYCVPVTGTSISILNANFDSPNLGGSNGTIFVPGIVDWPSFGTTVNNAFLQANDPSAAFASTPNNDQLGVEGFGASAGDTSSQTLTTNLAANTTYTMTFWVGNPNLQFGFGWEGYRVSLSAGGVTLVLDTTDVTPAVGSFLLDTVTWDSATATSAQLAVIGDPLNITLFQGTPANQGGTVAFADIALDGTADQPVGSVPEPSEWVLISTGLAAIAYKVILKRRPTERGKRGQTQFFSHSLHLLLPTGKPNPNFDSFTTPAESTIAVATKPGRSGVPNLRSISWTSVASSARFSIFQNGN